MENSNKKFKKGKNYGTNMPNPSSRSRKDVPMLVKHCESRITPKKKKRNALIPSTPRIALSMKDIEEYRTTKREVDVSMPSVRYCTSGVTPKKKARSALTPLTPRIALAVTDTAEFGSIKQEGSDVKKKQYSDLTCKIISTQDHNYMRRASSSEEIDCEEPSLFLPSDTEYYPSSSDSASDVSDNEKTCSDTLGRYSTSSSDYIDANATNTTRTAGDGIENVKYSSTESSIFNIESNIIHQNINPAPEKKWSSRYHFCPFCKQRVTRFARHVLNTHNSEPEVIEINVLPPKNSERYDKIAALRKKGMYEYNTSMDHNKGDIIVNRRPTIQHKKKVENPYIPCKNCKGFYRSTNLPKHYKMCSGQISARGIIRCGHMLSRKVLPRYFEYIEIIIRNGRQDTLSEIILNDEAILYYGAKLASKYMHVKHMDNHIRSNMRLLARLLISVKHVDPSIQCLTDSFKPSKIEVMLTAARDICEYNQEQRCFQNPSAALHISGIILKCCEALIIHYIQIENDIMKQQIDNFKCLVKTEFAELVRMGHANLIQNKLSSPISLPLAADICKLNTYLRNSAKESLAKLETEPFSFNLWRNLASYTLVLLLIFNRRRTGETERLTLDNYNAKSSIAEGTDIYESLEEHEKILCHNFYRLEIRGKWGRSVPILLTKTFITYINKIIEFREKAGVAADNPYVFGVGASSHLHAGKILRDVSNQCGAANPNALRGTYMRKQIATVTQIIDMSDSDIKLLSQFMGHSQLIHEQSYRKTDATLQIARLSKLLMAFNNGQLNRYKGCSLDQLDIDTENEALVISTEDENNSPIDDSNNTHDEHEIRTPTIRRAQDSKITKCRKKLFKVPDDILDNPSTSIQTPRKRNPTKNCILSPRLETHNQPKINCQRTFVSKLRWSVPERRTIRRLFLSELKRGVLPSFSECTAASLNEPTLSRRSAKMIYAYINNLNKRNTKKKN